MTNIELDDRMRERLTAFKPFFEAVLGEPLDWQGYAHMLLIQGLESFLFNIYGHDPSFTLTFAMKMSELEPDIVSKLLTMGWEAASKEQREQTRLALEQSKRRIGFQPPPTTEDAGGQNQ